MTEKNFQITEKKFNNKVFKYVLFRATVVASCINFFREHIYIMAGSEIERLTELRFSICNALS